MGVKKINATTLEVVLVSILGCRARTRRAPCPRLTCARFCATNVSIEIAATYLPRARTRNLLRMIEPMYLPALENSELPVPANGVLSHAVGLSTLLASTQLLACMSSELMSA